MKKLFFVVCILLSTQLLAQKLDKKSIKAIALMSFKSDSSFVSYSGIEPRAQKILKNMHADPSIYKSILHMIKTYDPNCELRIRTTKDKNPSYQDVRGKNILNVTFSNIYVFKIGPAKFLEEFAHHIQFVADPGKYKAEWQKTVTNVEMTISKQHLSEDAFPRVYRLLQFRDTASFEYKAHYGIEPKITAEFLAYFTTVSTESWQIEYMKNYFEEIERFRTEADQKIRSE